MSHAEFTPSSAYRWLPCGLSQKFALSFPDYPSEAAAKGTALHEAAAQSLMLERRSTHEIVGGYVNYALNRSALEAGSKLFVEHKVFVNPVCWGTADAVIRAKSFIEVVDLKTGKGLVSPYKNPQLSLYGLGFVKELGVVPADMKVILTIAQPTNKASPIKSWGTTAGDLRAFEVSVDRAIVRSYQADPPAIVGDHCAHCKGRMFCKEFMVVNGLKKSLTIPR